MCLAIPMRIIKVEGDFAEVASGGLMRTVNIQMLPRARKGDYILVHAGFAIEKLDPDKARETLKMIYEVR